MKIKYFFMMILFLSFFSGCSHIPSIAPVGEINEDADLSLFAGYWVSSNTEDLDDMMMHVRIIDEESKLLEVRSAFKNSSDQDMELYIDRVILREYKGHLIWNLLYFTSSEDKLLYYWGFLYNKEDGLEICFFKREDFDRLIEELDLELFRDKEQNYTGKIMDSHLDFILSEHEKDDCLFIIRSSKDLEWLLEIDTEELKSMLSN